jgi:Uma2 family endonuclease
MTPAAAEPDTLADVLAQLGDIPPHRILWRPYPGTATEADLLRSRQCELVDGMLVRKSLGGWKGVAEVSFGCRVMEYVHPRRLGAMTMASGPYRVRPDVVRLPDLAFIRWDRMLTPDRQIPDVVPAAPDLVIEIPTPDNTPAELARKYREFFAAGTRLLWELDLETRTATVFTDPTTRTVLTEVDTLVGDPVLPGFALPLADLFNDPQLNPRP